MKYKNLVLDVGEVLLSYRWEEMMMDYGLSREEANRFYSMMLEDPLWDEFDLEILPFEEVMAKYISKNPSHEAAIRYFLTHIELMPLPRQAVYERVERLMDAGMRVYILSNYPSTLFKEHTKLIPFMDRLSGMVVSSSIHIMKPDRRMYEALYRKCGILPGESIFFDDRVKNTDGAIATGMDAVCVPTEEELLRQLDLLWEQGK